MNETNEPENQNKYDEEYWINHSQEGQPDFPLWLLLLHPRLPSILFRCPGLSDLTLLLLVVLSEGVYVGLHQDIHEGFEETEDQPAVDHLDVGGVGQLGVHTNKELSDLSISLFMFIKIFP